jgi:CRISPR-associated protein Cas1
MLNYAYAVLESQVRIATVSQGLDPTIAYLYTSRRDQVALVNDLMEPLCPRVNYFVLDSVGSHTFSSSDLMLATDRACRLHLNSLDTFSIPPSSWDGL